MRYLFMVGELFCDGGLKTSTGCTQVMQPSPESRTLPSILRIRGNTKDWRHEIGVATECHVRSAASLAKVDDLSLGLVL